MREKRFIGLCLIGASVALLSGCGETSRGYSEEVVDGYYTYNAIFQNGAKKSYILNEDIDAAVVGNCLVYEFNAGASKTYTLNEYLYNAIDFRNSYISMYDDEINREVLDIENNSLTRYYTKSYSSYEQEVGYYEETSIYKDVIQVSSGSIDRWLKENYEGVFRIEEDFKDLKYSYSIDKYVYEDGEWLKRDSSFYESIYDDNGNEISRTRFDRYIFQRLEFTYNEDNKAIKRNDYSITETGDYHLDNFIEYTYDDSLNLIKEVQYDEEYQECYSNVYTYDANNNLINKKEYRWDYSSSALCLFSDYSCEYDSDNHLVLETMKYIDNQDAAQQLCWSSMLIDYKKEYRYDQDKLIYEHDFLYANSYSYSSSVEGEFFYEDDKMKQIIYDRNMGTKKVYESDSDGRILCEAWYDCLDPEEENFFRIEYSYDSNHNLIGIDYYESQTNVLTLYRKIEFSYDSNNNMIEQRGYSVNDFVNTLEDKSSYSSDTNGLLKQIKVYIRNNNGGLDLFYYMGIEFKGTEFKSFSENSNPIE